MGLPPAASVHRQRCGAENDVGIIYRESKKK
jgi:hypothetical protein